MTTAYKSPGCRAFLVAATIAGLLGAPRAGSAQPAPGKPTPSLARPRLPLKPAEPTRGPDKGKLARPGEPVKGAPPPPPPGRLGAPGVPVPPGGPLGPVRPGGPLGPGRPGVPGAVVPVPGAPRDIVPGEREFNECKKVPGNKKIKLTLKPESELQDLVGWISGMTCRKFILPSNVRSQKVTIIAPEPVSAGEAYRLFLSALATMGLTVEPTGGFLRIIESNRGKESNVPMCAPDEDCPHDDRFVTRMVKLKHVSADEMMAVLNRLKSKDADIIAYQPSNTLIVSEWGSNLRRLVEIVDALDIGTAVEKIFWIKLKYAYATEVAAKLQEIFQIGGTTGSGTGGSRPGSSPPMPGRPGGRGGPAGMGGEAVGEAASDLAISRIVPDDRTHSLILVCTDKAFDRIKILVHKIDVPPALGRQRIHVYYLANANADEMAGVLQGLVSGSGGAGRVGTTGTTPGRTGTTGTTPQRSTTSPYGGSSYGGGGGYGMGQQGQFQLFESPISISSDKGTNALVIIATMEDFLQLREVVHKLDRPRRQVFVEAVILEVALDRSLNLGTSWHGGNTYDVNFGKQSGTGLLFGGSITNQSANSILLSPSALSGLAVGFRGPEIPNAENLLGIPGLSLPAFGVFFQALQTNNDVNVLSAPHILTTDNEKAEITVGQNLPFQGALVGGISGFGTGTSGATGGSSAAGGYFPSVSVQRQDVALKLSLTPHVNEGDFVRIELDQEISDIVSENFNNLGPATSKRTAKTVIVCKDTQTVVIGGLMAHRITNSETKIPLLGDLPILGYLFKTTVKKTQRTNLLIFLTPYIIKDQNDLKAIFERKLRERREFLERYTSFRDKDWESATVYRTRRGMLAELERTARTAEDEAKLLEQAERQLERSAADEGPIMEAPPSATRKGGSLVPSGGTPGGTAPRGTTTPTRPTAPGRPPVRGPR